MACTSMWAACGTGVVVSGGHAIYATGGIGQVSVINASDATFRVRIQVPGEGVIFVQGLALDTLTAWDVPL